MAWGRCRKRPWERLPPTPWAPGPPIQPTSPHLTASHLPVSPPPTVYAASGTPPPPRASPSPGCPLSAFLVCAPAKASALDPNGCCLASLSPHRVRDWPSACRVTTEPLNSPPPCVHALRPIVLWAGLVGDRGLSLHPFAAAPAPRPLTARPQAAGNDEPVHARWGAFHGGPSVGRGGGPLPQGWGLGRPL